MRAPGKILAFLKVQPRWRLVVACALLLLTLLWLVPGSKSTNNSATFTTRRGPLDITVLEGGNIQALESQELKCEVKVGYQALKF